ncbi:MAG: DNA translocase FtsK 4TM domain-containing protein [Candidatus Kerfeldbacteria bacterium]|nr:DNA translocase FtsK 4TM domain-containing protein [Candidatus Kerfeldbacteria bacterium]
MSRATRGNGTQAKKLTKQSPLAPATKHGLVVVFLFAAALIIIVSFAGGAGLVGEGLSHGLKLLLGWAAWGVPLVLLSLAYAFIYSSSWLKLSQLLGLALLIFGLTGLFHSTIPWVDVWPTVSLSRGGGYLGFIVLWPLNRLMGLWGSIVLLVALSAAGILLLFETSVASLLRPWRQLILVLRRLVRFSGAGSQANQSPYPPSVVRESEVRSPEATEFQARSLSPSGLKPEQPPLLTIRRSGRRPVRVQVPLELLEERLGKPSAGDIEANQEKIKRTLQNFGIEVEMGRVNVGPTVAQYTLAPADGVKLASITALANDLALALAAHPIRIEAPIPGQSLVGIEVPNQAIAVVSLKEVLQSDEFKKRSSNLTFGLGKDVAGKPWVADLERMPHLLIAGATGSGKSVCINSLLLSLLYTNSADDLKLIIVDPKRVELSSYNDVPHLLTPVVTDINKTINALKWVVAEMDRRYRVLAAATKRNLQAFNQAAAEEEKMPYLVVVIDELADLMAVAAADVETAIIRLAQMARAVGIHLVVATQRPSVDVITGLIKANITSRLAFAVASATDSRTILDTGGAEKLLGQGDCLFITAELSKPRRLQAVFVGDGEIERVTSFIKQQASPEYNNEVVTKSAAGSGIPGVAAWGQGEDGDELLGEAKLTVMRAGKASASLLQRRLRVGYARAARLLDLLEEQGVIGPGDGAKPREVLVGRQDVVNDFVSPNEGEDDDEKPDEAVGNGESDTASAER